MAEKNYLQVFKKVITMVIIISSAISCTAQKEIKNPLKKDKMRTFDIVNFEKKKGENNEYSFKEGDTLIIQFKEDYFREYRFNLQEKNYKKLFTYSNKGKLMGEATYFLGILTGKVIEYDEYGNLAKEIDYTRPEFTFTIEQLAEKMKSDYNIDLYNTDDNWVLFAFDESDAAKKSYIWVVWYKSKYKYGENRKEKAYVIDGQTGVLKEIRNQLFQQGGSNPKE